MNNPRGPVPPPPQGASFAYFLPPARVLTFAGLALLYLSGIAFWLRSFLYSKLFALDWSLTLNYQEILKQALLRRRVPYLSTFHHYTDRFLGTPETPLSPQFLLVPWLDPWTFNFLNVVFLYSLSFLGLLLIRRRHGLTWLPFTLLFLLFSFNGSIVGRVSFGHTMWYGYFLLPFLYLCLFDIVEVHRVQRAALGMAFTLFLMALQGSFHLVVWTLMLLGLTTLFCGRRGGPILHAVVWTMLLCAFRIMPSAITLHGIPLEFHDAYPTLGTFFDGLTAVRRAPWMDAELGCGWVDMNCYVGFTGFLLLLWFGWICPFRDPAVRGPGHWSLYPAVLCLIALSMGPVYQHIFESGLPVLSSQRIPSRFNMVIISAVVVFGAITMQRCLSRPETGRLTPWFFALALLPLTRDLYNHQTLWTLQEIEVWHWKDAGKPKDLITLLDLDMTDPSLRRYVHILWASSAISLTAFLAWTWQFHRACKRQR